jgi:hypothetical protein
VADGFVNALMSASGQSKSKECGVFWAVPPMSQCQGGKLCFSFSKLPSLHVHTSQNLSSTSLRAPRPCLIYLEDLTLVETKEKWGQEKRKTSPTKLEIRAEQILPGSREWRGERRGGWGGKGGG